jgi:hypothetical protein
MNWASYYTCLVSVNVGSFLFLLVLHSLLECNIVFLKTIATLFITIFVKRFRLQEKIYLY